MLFGNARVLREDGSIAGDLGVLVENGRIIETGDTAELKRKHGVEFYDCRGRILMPGMVCAHTHIYSAFARGMSVRGPLTDFPNILKNLWWKLDSVLDRESVEYSAWVSFIEGVKHGTTTYFDHHASPQFIAGSLDTIADVAAKLGVRVNLSYEITDRYGEAKAEEAIRENERFVKNRGPMVSGTIGIHASFTVSDTTFERIRAVKDATGAGIHIHVAEDTVDQKEARENHGMDVVSRIAKFGLLDERALCVHCIHLSENELENLGGVSANIIHCPESNMNNAVGYAKIPLMLERGLKVYLGTDGFTHDMFTEAKVCHILHKFANADPCEMPASTVWRMLSGNAELAERFFGVKLGKIAENYAADFILIDYRNYTEITPGNFPWHFIFGLDAAGVRDVVVNGKIVLNDGKLEGLDEEGLMEKGIKISRKIWEKVNA
ncbi:MAG: putative aminohydrolase SsnA [Thermoplasmata archaeon]|nr:putative aminohydrolase SsnA [Thermoplasmata archaeon]